MVDEGFFESVRSLVGGTQKHAKVILAGAVLSVFSWALLAMGTDRVAWKWLVIGLCVTLLVAAFLAFHDVRLERDKAQLELKTLEECRPLFRVVAQKSIPVYLAGQQYLFDALQIWILNEPARRTVDSLASNVSVRLGFFADNATKPRFEFGTQWVMSTDPENAGFEGTSQAINIPANHNPAKFFLVLHHVKDDVDCYALSFGKLGGSPDGRFPPYRLVPGHYRVKVSLRGDNVQQEIWLSLNHQGQLVHPEVAHVPKIQDCEVSA